LPLSRSNLDAVLGQAQTKVAQLGGRLFDVDAELQRRTSTADRLQGASAAAWQGARDQVSVMWAWYPAVSQVIGSIAARLQSAGLDRRELEFLWSELTGPSVELGAESMELAGRCLPDEVVASSTWALEPLIGLMSKVIEGAAETITSVVAIGEMASSKLAEIVTSLSHSEAIARRAGGRVPNGAAAIRDRVQALREQLATDPLAIPLDGVAALSAAAARLAQEVEEAVAELSGLEEVLDRIRVDFEAGIDDLARARQDLAEVEMKIARPHAAPTIADADDLASRLGETGLGLDEARRRATSGDRASAVRLAAVLGPAAAELRAAAHALAASASASLARRRELRGRLDAYRAKAYQLGRAEDPTLMELYRLTQYTLYHAPCDLDEAERRLAGYQEGVLAAGGKPGTPTGQTADASRLVGPSPDTPSGSRRSRSSGRDTQGVSSPAGRSGRAEGRDEHEM
jgi:hypothetical protein